MSVSTLFHKLFRVSIPEVKLACLLSIFGPSGCPLGGPGRTFPAVFFQGIFSIFLMSPGDGQREARITEAGLPLLRLVAFLLKARFSCGSGAYSGFWDFRCR